MTFSELIEKVLTENKNKPMSGTEMWNYVIAKGYDKIISSVGKSPKKTMTSVLYTDMKKKSDRKYKISGTKPKKFALKK